MKFKSFLILLAICAFQVDFTLSSVESRRQVLTNLWYRADNLIKVLAAFKNSEVNLNSEKIFNSTISALDHVTNLTLDTQKEIEENATILIEDDDLIDVDSCLDAALTALSAVIALDCGSFGKCQQQAVTEIEIISNEITEIIKKITEIKRLIIVLRDVTCKGYTSAYAKELCLYCKTPQFEMDVNSFTTKIEIFKIRITKIFQKLITIVSSCQAVATEEAEKKIDAIKQNITECFTNLCEIAPTTLPPVNLTKIHY